MIPIFLMGRGFDVLRPAYGLLGAALNQIEAVHPGLALAALDEVAQGLVFLGKALVYALVRVARALDEFDRPVRRRSCAMNSHVHEIPGRVNKALEL